MLRRTPRTAAAVGALALLGTLAACGGPSSAATPLGGTGSAGAAAHPEWAGFTFTVGDNGGDGTEALAKTTGAFDTAPYTVRFARFTFGPPLVQAAVSGDIDLGSVGDVPPITGAAKEYGFKVVAVTHSLRPTRPTENILVPKGSSIRTLADLRGRRLAVPQGSSAHGLVLNALTSAGLTPQDVTLVFLDPAAGATAFATGKVDAWAIWNPQSALAVERGARVLAKGLPPIDQTSNYYVASDASLKDPAKRAALTDVLERLANQFHWAVRHPDRYAQAIAQEEGIPLSDAKAVLPTMETRMTPVDHADIAAEQQLGDAFLAAGQIDRKVDVAAITDNLLPSGYDSAKLR